MATKYAVSLEIFNRSMINALEFMDQKILDLSIKSRRMWYDLIPRGSFPLGEGLVRKRHRFFADKLDQSGLTNWGAIQIGRDAGGDDPGFDACSGQEAELIKSAMETVNFTGYENAKRTEDYCIRDIRFTWEFKQQIALMLGFLGEVSIGTWENLAREIYLRMCGQEGQIYVMSNGAATANPLSANYDPFSTTDITIPRSIALSTLNWNWFNYWREYLTLLAPVGALNGSRDDPRFGITVHPNDFQDMILRDDHLREDFRYANPNLLIQGYGGVTEFKGWAIMSDLLPPRFKEKAGGLTETTITLERVEPFLKEATTIGEKPVVNPEYLTAEYALGTIFMKNVFTLLIPPAGPSAPGGGTQFGTVPDLMGTFAWINIKDRVTNMLGEKGFYFARYESFVRPEENSRHAIAFLYRRCPQIVAIECEACADEVAAGTWQTITAAEAVPDEDAGESDTVHTVVEITLANCLGCEPPSEIEISFDGTGASADATGVLIASAEAPTYRIQFATQDDWVAGDTIVAGTSSIRCA